MARGPLPLVVKVGGSLCETGRMPAALSIIAGARVPIVIVPGGGTFADNIRAQQLTINFSDAVAHRLAMLAMRQMAELIIAQNERFVIAETLEEISTALSRKQVPVWAPLKMISGDASVPAGWSATSDSLAARLAELLGAELLLLKSIDVERDAVLDELARRGVVDPLLPSIVARSGLSWSILGPSGDARLGAVLVGEGEP